MGNPTKNQDKVLSQAAILNSNKIVRGPAAQVINLPGGVPDPGSIIVEGEPLLQGQESESVFFRRLADDFVTKTLGTPHGDDYRDDLVLLIADLLKSTLTDLAGNEQRWETWLRRELAVGSDQRITPDQLREQIIAYINPNDLVKLEQRAVNITDEEALDRHAEDKEFDTDLFMAALTPSVASLIVSQQIQLAREVAAAKPPNSIEPNRFDGIQVHKRIQEHYLVKRPHFPVIMERAIFTIGGIRIPGTISTLVKSFEKTFPEIAILDLALSTVGAGRLRPDILDFKLGEVYEIKPRSQAVQALLQVNGYCGMYNLIPFKDKRLLTPGFTYEPPRLINATNSKIALIFQVPGLPGLILYDLFKTNKDAEKALQKVQSLNRDILIFLVMACLALGAAYIFTCIDPVPGNEFVIPMALAHLATL